MRHLLFFLKNLFTLGRVYDCTGHHDEFEEYQSRMTAQIFKRVDLDED